MNPRTLPLVLDPDDVAALGRAKRAAHWALHARLAPRLEQGDTALAARLQSLLVEIAAQVDCTRCGRCCAQMGPTVDDATAEGLARAVHLTPRELRERYLRPMWPGSPDAEQVWLFPDPCPMHDGLLCKVYEARPRVCRDFPIDVGATPAQRFEVMVETAAMCPIAFNVVEGLSSAMDDDRA